MKKKSVFISKGYVSLKVKIYKYNIYLLYY